MASTKEKEITPLLSITRLIHGLLLNNKMTMRELVDCLMSEPYDVPHTSIILVPIALNYINDFDHLRVGFRISRENRLAVEPVFHTVP